MSDKYQPSQFEKKWIEKWKKDKIYHVSNAKGKEKMYVLDMFPYPSGAGLHVGHPRGYTATDILSRYYRMNNYSVLHPMGWDAFGLPAENAAVKAKKNPMDIVPLNIANFKRQMQMLGFSYDWSREFSTTDPAYYKWTQWLFIQFFKMGLLYKKNTPINYCPKCKTGLAEEEVLSNGTHERCGTPIEKKDLPQWLFRITAYADRLLKDLDDLQWPKGILEMQRNWIGRKEGININYRVLSQDDSLKILSRLNSSRLAGLKQKVAQNFSSSSYQTIDKITCFTTRPDTNFGATFIVIAPEHEFVKNIKNQISKIKDTNQKLKLEKNLKEIEKYVNETKSKSEIDRQAEERKKTGVFTGFYAVNQLNGCLMPIWISDFVLMGFGTGAVVGVPGHDLRDFEFAKEFNLPIIRVVIGKDQDTSEITKKEQVQEEEGTMVNSEFLDGMDIHQATIKIMDYIEEKGWGKRVVTYHLRDWIFSRQRYWGEPIPMVFCERCAKNQAQSPKPKTQSYNSKFKIKEEVIKANFGWFPLSEDKLPLELPYVKSYEPGESGESPLANIDSFVKTTCPNCGEPAKRETDTMPNWAGSCWYFIRFAQNQKSKIKGQSKESISIENWKLKIKNSGNHWLPVDWYFGGAEHAVLHLLYSRFWVKALQDLGLLDFSEPFLRLRNVGMVLAEDNRKMSKSYGNVINPDDVVKEFGADSLRMYEMFMAPFSQEIAWSTKTLQGVHRFLIRVWNIFQKYKVQSSNIKNIVGTNLDSPETKKGNSHLIVKLNQTIDKITQDITAVKYNTAIAMMMEFLNEWEGRQNQKSKVKSQNYKSKVKNNNLTIQQFNNILSTENAKKFLKILAPFAPFITEEIWRGVFGEKESIHLSSWPKVEKMEMGDVEITIPVQVNGKLRGTIIVQSSTLRLRSGQECKVQSDVVAEALKQENIAKYLEGKKYKVIYVEGKILNLAIMGNQVN